MRTELCIALALTSPALATDFADTVVDYATAPGQLTTNPAFNDPTRALGAPIGEGTFNANTTDVVTLGGFGGSITLAFSETVLDDPRNPFGLDAIVFGNAFWQCLDGCSTANPNNRWLEAGVIEISLDENDNGLADDTWFVIRGSSLPAIPNDSFRTMSWPSAPPTSGFELPADFTPPPPFFVVNDFFASEMHWGYADASPTLLLGDTTGALGFPAENTIDDPDADPSWFYTSPDDPTIIGINPRTAGGDAFDIAWAVDPATGAPANLPGFDFIRIRTGVHASLGPLGEISTEIDAVADARAIADFNGDDRVNAADLAMLLAAWGTDTRFDLNTNGTVDSADLAILLANWG